MHNFTSMLEVMYCPGSMKAKLYGPKPSQEEPVTSLIKSGVKSDFFLSHLNTPSGATAASAITI